MPYKRFTWFISFSTYPETSSKPIPAPRLSLSLDLQNSSDKKAIPAKPARKPALVFPGKPIAEEIDLDLPLQKQGYVLNVHVYRILSIFIKNLSSDQHPLLLP